MSGPYGLSAEMYWRAGWRPIPLPPRLKYPPPEGFTGAKGVAPSFPDIMTWLDGPDALGNVALRMAPDVIGIDVDDYAGKIGGQTFADALKRMGPLPDTPISTSRPDDPVSGIRFFRVPEGLRWPGVVGPDVEIIQARHRYAVAWPSIHPDTGNTYAWSSGEIPSVDTLPDMPESWVQGLTGGACAVDIVKADVGSHVATAWLDAHSGVPCARTTRAAATAVQALTGHAGSRHDQAMRSVMRLAHMAAEGHTGVSGGIHAVGSVWLDAVTSGTGARSVEDARSEWSRIVCGAVAVILGQVQRADPEDPCIWNLSGIMPMSSCPELEADDVTPDADGTKVPRDSTDGDIAFGAAVADAVYRLKVRDEAQRLVRAEQRPEIPPPVRLDSLLAEIDDAPTYRIGGLLPTGGRVVLSAQRKAGKTVMTGNLLRCLADGDPFLGVFPVVPVEGQAVVLDFEMSRRTLRRWLSDQTIERVDAVTLWSLRGRAGAFDILDSAVRREWVKRLSDINASILIIDCLKPVLDALGIDENRETGRFLSPLDALLNEAGVNEHIMLHHAGHMGERSRGDSRLRDWPDAEWRIMRDDPDEPGREPAPDAKRFFTAEGRDVAVPEGELIFDPVTRRLRLVEGGRRESRASSVIPSILDLVALNPPEGLSGWSGREIERRLMGQGHRQRDIRSAITEAVRTGAVDRISGPRNATLHVLSKVSASVRRSASDALTHSDQHLSASVRRSASDALTHSGGECVSASIGRTAHTALRPHSGFKISDALKCECPNGGHGIHRDTCDLGGTS